MKRTTFTLRLFVLAIASLLSVPAHADTITLTLTNPVQVGGLLGTSLDFDATVSAPGKNSGDVFLNADSFNVDAPLTLDDDGFFFGFPLSLSPGQTFSGLLFTVFLPTNTPNAIYNGSFSILGGADGSAANDLADVTFQVNTVPEPATLLMLGSGFPGLVAMIRRKRGITS
jgi:PEP-CTERM motif